VDFHTVLINNIIYTKLASVSLCCKSHCSKKANIRMLSTCYKHGSQLRHLGPIPVSDLTQAERSVISVFSYWILRWNNTNNILSAFINVIGQPRRTFFLE